MPTPTPAAGQATRVATSYPGYRPLLAGLAVFLLAALTAGLLIWWAEQHRLHEARARVADLASDSAHAIQRNIEHALSATYALGALVRQGKGQVPDFDTTAREMLPYFPGAASLQLAPSGVVRQVFPLAGNEKAIGHNLLQDPARDKEAFKARESGHLTLAGPFTLVQGGLGAAGRLPIYLDSEAGRSVFWGFATVLLKFPKTLEDARLPELAQKGYSYELWRIHPDTQQKQTIVASAPAALIDPVQRSFALPNGSWTLSMAPLSGWGDPLGLSIKITLGLLFSLLLGYMARLLVELQLHKKHLEQLVWQRTAEIADTHTKLEATFNAIPDLVWLKDAQGTYLNCNPMFERFFGAKKREIVGKTDYDFIPRSQADFFREHDRQAMLASTPCRNEEWLTFAADTAGQRRLFETTKVAVRNAEGALLGVLGLAHEITEYRAAMAKIERLTQLYAALSLCNQAIVHCTSEAELFAQICNGVVQHGGMKMAWIGLLDDCGQQVRAVSSAGEGVDYLNNIQISTQADDPHGGGPIGIALRHNQPVWVQDFQADPRTAPWHERATRFGWGSSAALPLHRNGQVVGTFTLYSGEPRAFDDEVRALLKEMASDLSYAMDGFDRERERQRAEAKLHLAASVFTNSREAIMITGADGIIIDVNDAFSQITGYSHDEVVGKNPRLLSSGHQSPEHYRAMWRALREKGHWYGEIWNRRKNGEVYAEMQTISAVHDAQGNIQQYVALFTDITVIKEHQKQLEHIAHFDSLTGLPNRVLLADRLHQGMLQAQRRGQRLAVAFLDLDGFKAINDQHGHEAGDQLLIAVASRMKEVLREGDSLARLGGDEFVAVLLDLNDVESSVPLLTRLLGAAAQPVQLDSLVLQVSASLGVTFYPQMQEIDADQLLRQADQAMYQAKLAGKNRFHVFDAEQDRSVRGHHESLERIRQALTAHEFLLYYQPKVNMRTGQVIGAEALIRWQHPQQGMLPPSAFLPVIEDHPLAIEVGEWVIATALTQIEAWQALGLNLTVSVNIGARQLQQPDFVARLRQILERHPQVQPASLELEVLETSALEDVMGVSRVIEDCRQIGVMFALDDFGTGYSSLTYLKRLAVSQLKIDQSFVRDMLDDPDDLAILDGVIGLATAFRRQVIAEGVETMEHGAMLLQLGCELAQGYGIARPMAANLLPDWVARWRPDPSWHNLPAVNREDLPLLFASVEHRSWTTAIQACLQGQRDLAPPALQPCRLGHWLAQEGLTGADDHFNVSALGELHERLHTLGSELLALDAQGQRQKALLQLDSLLDLQDRLFKQLRQLAGNRRH